VDVLDLGPFVEVSGAKVRVEGSMFQHVIRQPSGSKHDGTDRLLRPAPGS
jgi:hypothetical protein